MLHAWLTAQNYIKLFLIEYINLYAYIYILINLLIYT